MALRDYAGNAKPSTLVSGITNTALAFDIPPADATSWPTGGANGKFVATLDRGLPSEERILVTSQSGGTCTIANLSDRGLDGTTAVAHSAGGKAEHTYASFEAEEANAHINNAALDHHTQYMLASGTRHDLTARHSAGTVVPTTTAVGLTVGGASAEGAGTNLARATHTHAIPKGSPVAIGTALSDGASGNFADAAHVHELGVGSIDASNLFGAGVVDSAALGAFSVIAGKLGPGSINGSGLFSGNEIVPPTAVNSEIATFTPTLFNVTIGTGGSPTNTGRFIKIGRIVVCWGLFVLGTTGNVTGDIGLGLPEDAHNPAIPSFCYLGGAQALGGGNRWASVGVVRPDTNPDRIQAFGTAGQSWGGTTPFNWTGGDLMRWFAAYIAAAI